MGEVTAQTRETEDVGEIQISGQDVDGMRGAQVGRKGERGERYVERSKWREWRSWYENGG